MVLSMMRDRLDEDEEGEEKEEEEEKKEGWQEMFKALTS